MKRSFSSGSRRAPGVLAAGTALIAATYGLVRLAYGLYLPDVQKDLPFDATAAGLISSGASVVYCVGAVIGFFAATRHPRSLIIAAGVSASAGAAGMAASQHAGSFAAFAILGSAGAGLASPGLVAIVRRNVAAGRNDRSQAIVNAGTGPGLVAAGVSAFVLLPDWRLAWFLVAAFTLVIALAVLLFDRGGSQDRAPGRGPESPGIPTSTWFMAHRRIIVAAFVMGAGSAAVWNYGRTLVVEAGASERASVGAWVALGVGGTAVIATARLLSGLPPWTVWTITTLTIAGATVTLALAPNAGGAMLTACAAFGWGYTAGTGALIAWTARIDPVQAPAGTSLLFVVLVLGQAFGAPVVGALASTAGFVTAFLVAAALSLAATAIPLLRPRQ